MYWRGYATVLVHCVLSPTHTCIIMSLESPPLPPPPPPPQRKKQAPHTTLIQVVHACTHTLMVAYTMCTWNPPTHTHPHTHTPTHRRNRAKQPGDSPYFINPDSIAIQDSSCQMDIVSRKTNVVLRADISSVEGNIFRVKISEKSPIRPRYEVQGALIGDPKLKK